MKKLIRLLIFMVISLIGTVIALKTTVAGVLVLQYAAQADNPTLAGGLITLGADVNGRTDEGLSALHAAAFLGSSSAAERFLDKGAKVDMIDLDGRTPLHLAAYAGHGETVSLLIDQGADPNARESAGGMTPLHLAAVGGHVEAARALLAKGAKVNAREKNQVTPLFIAYQENKTEVAKLLKKHGGR